MNKNKLQLFLIAGLLLSNIMLVVYLLIIPKHPNPSSPKEIIIERLNFDKDQTAEYDKLIQQHQQQIRENQRAIMELKNNLYSHLRSNENNAITDSLAKEIGKTQTKIELIHYAHFEDIKKLCREDQMNEYNELINELARLFSPRPRMKKTNNENN